MRNILLFLIIIFCLCAWTYTYDFEDGVVGNVASSTNNGLTLGAGTESKFDNTHTNGGSLSCKFNHIINHDGWNETHLTINFPDITIIDGVTEMWGSVDVYFGQASDNPSGNDWSNNQYDPLQADWGKFYRIHKTESDGDNNGYNSIYFMQNGLYRLDNEFTDNVNLFQHQNYTYMPSGEWHTLRMYYKFGTVTAVSRLWIDNNLVVDRNYPTIDANAYALNLSYFYSYWNGNHPQNQCSWIDNLMLTNEDPEWTFPEVPVIQIKTLKSCIIQGKVY